jgi:type IV pilus assembly protein PilB
MVPAAKRSPGGVTSMKFIRLGAMMIPESVFAMVPESMARELVIMPIAVAESGRLTIAIADTNDWDTLEKVCFILNKDIVPVQADRFDILAAIDRHYGPPGDHMVPP